jgi:hypothetical protein
MRNEHSLKVYYAFHSGYVYAGISVVVASSKEEAFALVKAEVLRHELEQEDSVDWDDKFFELTEIDITKPEAVFVHHGHG